MSVVPQVLQVQDPVVEVLQQWESMVHRLHLQVLQWSWQARDGAGLSNSISGGAVIFMLVVAVQWDTLMIPEEQEVPAVVEQEAEHQPQVPAGNISGQNGGANLPAVVAAGGASAQVSPESNHRRNRGSLGLSLLKNLRFLV